MSKLNIFISYKHGEGDVAAREIKNYLTIKKHYLVFRDIDSLGGGEDWDTQIRKSIQRSNVFIILLTPNALKSSQVDTEISQAQEQKKRIIPCKLDNIEFDKLKWNLGKLHVIEYSQENISALLLDIDNSINIFVSEKRKHVVTKGILLTLPIVAIAVVFYFLLAYILNPQIEVSYQSKPDVIIGKDYAQLFVNLSNPEDIEIDSTNNVYVANTKNDKIQKFTSDGNFTKEWGKEGSAPGKFSFPSGIAVDISGNVYVADTGNNRIQKFTSDGDFIKEWGQQRWGGHGSAPGELFNPSGIAVDISGNVYVADTYNYRIQKFTSDGNFTKEWGGEGSAPGKFSFPHGIAVDTSGNIYVADTYNYRIQKFTSDGNFIKEWGKKGSAPGEFSSPSGLAVDITKGIVYVADTGNNRIQKFTSNGIYLSDFGQFGNDENKFTSPMDVDVDSNGNIYVADTGNNRIQKIEGSSIKTWKQLDTSNPISFDFPTSITIDLLDNVYVADTNNHKIHRFDSTGKIITSFGEFGFNASSLNFPSGILVDKDRNVYVADTGNNQIKKFIVEEKEIRRIK